MQNSSVERGVAPFLLPDKRSADGTAGQGQFEGRIPAEERIKLEGSANGTFRVFRLCVIQQ